MTSVLPLFSVVPTSRKATIAVSPYCWMRMSSAVYVVAGPAGGGLDGVRMSERMSALPMRRPEEPV